MFTERQLLIISFLLSDHFPKTDTLLADVLGISKRTVQNEIKIINKVLPTDEALSVSARGKAAAMLSGETKERLQKLVAESPIEKWQHDFERKNLIFLILLFKKEYESMEEVANRLYVSKSMIHKEMQQSWKLREFISVSAAKGLKINVSESQKRNILSKLFTYTRYLQHLLELPEESPAIFANVQESCDRLFPKHGYTISGKSQVLFQNYLFLTIIRKQMGFSLNEEEEAQIVHYQPSALLTELLAELLYDFSQADIFLIQGKLNELNVINYTKNIEEHANYPMMSQQLQIFTERLKKELGILFAPDETWKNLFFVHLFKLQIRLRNATDNANYRKRSINTTYPLTAQIVRDYFLPIFQMDMPESEMAYLVLYFAEHFENPEPELLILFITDALPSMIHHTVQLLKTRLSTPVKEVNIATLADYQRLSETDLQRHLLILTTSEKVVLNQKNAFLVREFMTDQDIASLKVYCDSLFRYHKQRQDEYFQTQYLEKSEFGILTEKDLPQIKEALTNEIVLESGIIFSPSFVNDQPTMLSLYKLEFDFVHKSKKIAFLVICRYNPAADDVQLFYRGLKTLLQESRLESALSHSPYFA